MTNQRVDEWGRVVLTEQGLLELLYRGATLTEDIVAEDTQQIAEYNKWCKTFDALDKQFQVVKPLDISPIQYHEARQKEWLIPDEYKTVDVEHFLYKKCKTPEQTVRVDQELELFKKHDMLDVLRLFIYITDTLRANDVWWGVGRGSSVASYCLFLIGVHKIDSLKYGLDIREFIRD